jgi:hypothetical protein
VVVVVVVVVVAPFGLLSHELKIRAAPYECPVTVVTISRTVTFCWV